MTDSFLNRMEINKKAFNDMVLGLEQTYLNAKDNYCCMEQRKIERLIRELKRI